MKATAALFVMITVFVGFALVGDALAQPDNPSPAATESSGDGLAAEPTKPEEGTADAKDPSASSESPKADDAKTEGEEKADGSDSKEGDDGKTAEEIAEDPVGALTQLVEAVRTGQWRMAAAVALSLLMFGWNWLRKTDWLKSKIDLSKDRAGAISVLALAVAGGLLTSLAADAPLDYKMVLGGLWTAVEAAGLFVLIKKIWKPADAAEA
jgi:hypothetical protein